MRWKRANGSWSVVVGPTLVWIQSTAARVFTARVHALGDAAVKARDWRRDYRGVLATAGSLEECQAAALVALRELAARWVAEGGERRDMGARVLAALEVTR
mgnify:CR=1 FL=1